MGLCESANNNIHSSAKKNKIKSLKKQSSSNNNKKNLYCSPIGTSNYLNNKNMSLSQTQITLGNQSYIQKPKPKPYVYQNNTNSISYIGINGNSFAKENSKLNSNSLSISNSYGELIIDNQINPEMKENKEFKEFFDSNYKDIIALNNDKNINAEEEEEVNKGSKKNLNLYHQFKKNKSKK
jgi:hypothetical protein